MIVRWIYFSLPFVDRPTKMPLSVNVLTEETEQINGMKKVKIELNQAEAMALFELLEATRPTRAERALIKRFTFTPEAQSGIMMHAPRVENVNTTPRINVLLDRRHVIQAIERSQLDAAYRGYIEERRGSLYEASDAPDAVTEQAEKDFEASMTLVGLIK